MSRRDDDDLEDEFEARLGRKRSLMEKGRREKDDSFWRYVGLIGVVGWGVVVPMVAGLVLGTWLDGRLGTGYRLRLGLLVAGLALGCYNAWRTITKEQH